MGLLNNQNETIEKQRNHKAAKPSCIDVTAVLSPVSCLARYCTQPEVKFDAFLYASNAGKKN